MTKPDSEWIDIEDEMNELKDKLAQKDARIAELEAEIDTYENGEQSLQIFALEAEIERLKKKVSPGEGLPSWRKIALEALENLNLESIDNAENLDHFGCMEDRDPFWKRIFFFSEYVTKRLCIVIGRDPVTGDEVGE